MVGLWRGIRTGLKRYTWVVLLVLIGAVFYAIHSFQAPAYGTITPVEETIPSKPVAAKPQPGVISDHYIHFSYPASYSKQEGSGQSAGNLSYYVLPKRDDSLGGAAQFGITIKKLDGTLTNDSSYIYRQKHSELYTAGSQTIAGQTAYTFSLNNPDGGYEKTVFWAHGNLLAIITLSGSFHEASFASDFQYVINSWQWK